MAYNENKHREYIAEAEAVKKTKAQKVKEYATKHGITTNHVYKLINYGKIKL